MKLGTLFTGIGAPDYAASLLGWETVFQVENNPECLKVLNKNFPLVPKHEDIKDFSGIEYRGQVDIVMGGFPCQPYSIAGKQRGDKDERSLWEEMLRVCRNVAPPIIVAENVTGLASISRGLALRNIKTSLEMEGYSVQCLTIPAQAVGAAHVRERLFIVAYAHSKRFCTGSLLGRTEREKIERPKRAVITREVVAAHARSIQSGDTGGRGWVPKTVDEHRIKMLGNTIDPFVCLSLFEAIEDSVRKYNELSNQSGEYIK